MNVAITLLPSCTGVNVQVDDVPTHPPAQLTKTLPAAGAAVSVSGSGLNWAEQVPPQLMPAGLDVTVPEPVPDLVTETPGRRFTVSETCGGVPLTLHPRAIESRFDEHRCRTSGSESGGGDRQ